MYLHYLLTLDQSQQLYRIFDAQRRSPVTNDWYIQVKADLEEFGLAMEDDEISSMKKETFKEQVKQACKQTAFQYLLKEKIKVQSKMGNLKYNELKMKEYLATHEITTKHKKLLFSLRTRMTNLPYNRGVKSTCGLCKDIEPEELPLNQEHLLFCQKLKTESQVLKQNTSVLYEDIFSEDVTKMNEAVKLFEVAIKTREKLLKAQ